MDMYTGTKPYACEHTHTFRRSNSQVSGVPCRVYYTYIQTNTFVHRGSPVYNITGREFCWLLLVVVVMSVGCRDAGALAPKE